MNHEYEISPDDKATNEWLNAQKKSTGYTYKRLWKWFLEFTGMTGDQIIESRKSDKECTWEKRVMEFRTWLKEQQKWSDHTTKTSGIAARSFFTYHRLPLKYRHTESAKLTQAKRVSEDYHFTREDLRKMADVADLRERYIIVAGKSFGLRAGDFIQLTRGDLETHINDPVPISIGEFYTMKEGIKAYPMIDSDAQPVIKLMLEDMNRKGLTEPNTRILQYKDEIQLSRVLERVADKAGINHGNKNIRFHCMRKFLSDHLSSHMSESKWKQIVGKTISEDAYISADSLREDYARAMVETTFTKPEASDVEREKQQLMTYAEIIMRVPEERRKLIFRQITAARTTEELAKVKEMMRDGCADGEHCQRLVDENKLPALLAQGWRVAAVLPSGKIVVSNE